MIDNRGMRKGCLDRPTLLAVASGRCPRQRLPEVQRHLSSCARCRASVVAAATGVRGPGETVFMSPRRGTSRRWPKRLAVAASLLAAAAAWLYGAAPPGEPAEAAHVVLPGAPSSSVEARAALRTAHGASRALSAPSEGTRYVGVSVVAGEPAETSAHGLP